MANNLEIAREACARRNWSRARAEFLRAQQDAPLEIDDLRALRRAAWWLGDGVGSMALAEQVYRQLMAHDARPEAAMECVELVLEWADRGDLQIAAGWLNRARRCLEGLSPSPAEGYLAYAESFFSLEVENRADRAKAARVTLTELAGATHDPALECLARALAGMIDVHEGRTEEGFANLDEAMLTVLAGELPPLWGGDLFCTVIHVCEFLGDFARMRAWTDSLDRWASGLSDVFMYAGITRVHQLQLQCVEGNWDVIEREADQLSERLVGSHGWVAAAGYLELGAVRRLRGDRAGARLAFDRARELGVDPQPGSALLLASEQGAAAALEELRASLATRSALDRARLLPVAVDLAIRVGDLESAEGFGAELRDTAARHQGPGLLARSHQTTARLAMSAGDWQGALAHLEQAAATFREQRYRYAIAEVHEMMAEARRGLGGSRAAAADEATALAIFRQLGALPDVERLQGTNRHPGGLTDREVEILGCIASGSSNRQVADKLCISEKTVGRHLSNIFAKIGVGSRTAAAAWAGDHGVRPRPSV